MLIAEAQATRVEREGGGGGDGGGDGCGDEEKMCHEFEAEESMTKPWNLRSRKSFCGGELQKSMRLRGFVEGQSSERKEKKNKFRISLSHEDIEEDVYALTGSRPARGPKKRRRTVQKQVDDCFPCLYLVGMTAVSYRVHESQR